MEKKRGLLCLALVVSLLLTPIFAQGTTETQAPKADEKVTITVWGPLENYSETDKKSWTYCVEEYRKRYPNVEVISVFSPAGTDYRQQYDKALMAGEAPTVTNLLPYVDVQSRASQGMAADISDFVNNWDLKKQGKVNDAMDQALQYNGKWYGVMDYIYIAGTVINKKTLEAAGGSMDKLPKTWDEFTAFGQKATDLSIPRFGYLLAVWNGTHGLSPHGSGQQAEKWSKPMETARTMSGLPMSRESMPQCCGMT